MAEIIQDVAPVVAPRQSALDLLRELTERGQPVTLTINGEAELAVEDATSREMLLQLVDRLETIESLRAGMKDFAEGRSVSLEEWKEPVRRR